MREAFVRRRIFVVVLTLVLALGGVAAPWAARPAAAADAAVVFAALDILKDQHFTGPDPVRLLDAAAEGPGRGSSGSSTKRWRRRRAASTRRSCSTPRPLPWPIAWTTPTPPSSPPSSGRKCSASSQARPPSAESAFAS